MIVYAFVNQKGGVGKTTSAVSISHGLALAGHRVLLVDLDSQGHVAVSFGADKAGSVYSWLVDESPPEAVIFECRPNVWAIRGDKSTDRVKRWAIGQDYREAILSDALEELESSYDFCLVDLSPSVDVLQTITLARADRVFIVTRLDHLSMDGVADVLETIGSIEKRSKRKMNVSIIPTMFERVTKETAIKFDELKDAFGDRVLPAIPTDTKAREATAHGQTIFEFCPKRPVTEAYQIVVDLVSAGDL